MSANQEMFEQSAYSWRFYFRPQDTWEAMYRDCERARKSIEFEQYILENDSVGQRFMELFIEKAKEGVKVFLICDMFGSALLSRSPLIEMLRQHDGHVYFYHKIRGLSRLLPWRWLPRTHTKTLLIDSEVAYTGGVCMAERMRHWRDTHIRVTGPVVKQIRHAFDEMENKILRKKAPRPPQPPTDQHFLYFLNRARSHQRTIYKEFTRAIQNAQDYVYIASAYFLPNRRFLRLLKHAHARGVEVRVLVPAKSDVRLADWTMLSYIPRFLHAGLRIYHYQETVMHSKIAMIDDRWATVGSANFDVLSFFYNREANIITTEQQAIAVLKQQFLKDLSASVEMDWESWKFVPIWKVGLGYIGRLIKKFLR